MSRVILRDGRVSEFRVLRDCEEDRQLLRDLFHRASPESMYYRFFHMTREVSEDFLSDLTGGDGVMRLSMVCIGSGRAVGVGSYAHVDAGVAEVSMLVDDAVHGKGVGTLLLEHLAEAARTHGYKQFVAHVLADNQKMIQLFVTSGYDLSTRHMAAEVEFTLPLLETDRRQALQDAREKLATVTSLEPFLQPHTVAVVAADLGARRLRDAILSHLKDNWFSGRVFSARSTACHGDASAALSDLPESIDLAILVGSPDRIANAVDECTAANVRGVVIASPGFSERSRDGQSLEQNIVYRLRSAGIRLLGPNSLGTVNTAPDVRCNASFADDLPEPGEMAIASQSGSLGLAMMRHANRMGVGVSNFVSMGNKADISGNDLLQLWEDDPNTRVIALHLESFGNPRKFARIARRVTRQKPILVVKGARSSVGVQVSESRQPTLAMRDAVVKALFEQTGVIEVDSVQELLETAALLSMCPLPGGRRVALVTNTAGGAVMAADCLLQNGLELAKQPVDLGFAEPGLGYEPALASQLSDPGVDAVLVIHVCSGFADEAQVLESMTSAVRGNHTRNFSSTSRPTGIAKLSKPVVAVIMAEEMEVRYVYADGARIPIYPFPEQAIKALAHAADYRDRRDKPPGRLPDLVQFDRDAAESIINRAVRGRRTTLTAAEMRSLLRTIGIPGPEAYSGSGFSDEHTLRVEVQTDPWFGPLLRVAAPAASADTCQEMIRILPLTDVDAEDVVRAVARQRSAGLKLPSGAIPALTELLLRLSRLMDEVPGLTEVCLHGVGPGLADSLSIGRASAKVDVHPGGAKEESG